MKRISLVLFIFLVGLTSVLFSKDDEVATFAGWQDLKNDNLKISTKLPKNWVVKENTENKTLVLSSDENIEKKDTIRIEIQSIDAAMHESDNVVFNRHIDIVQKSVKDFANLEKENEKFKTLSAIKASYEITEYEFKRKAILKYFRCNDKDYFYTLVCNTEDAEQQIAFFDRVLESSNPFEYQKFPLFNIEMPTSWHEFKEEGFVLAASKDEKTDNISQGVIKVFVRRIDKELSLSNYTTQLISSVYDQKGKSPSMAITPKIQPSGVQFQYFDLVDSEDLLKERYFVYKYDQFVYVIYFIAGSKIFDQYKTSELTKVLQSFSLITDSK